MSLTVLMPVLIMQIHYMVSIIKAMKPPEFLDLTLFISTEHEFVSLF